MPRRHATPQPRPTKGGRPSPGNQVASGWTLYDLRKLRFHHMGNVSADLQRMIDGYDLLVIIPELTPAGNVE